MVEQGGAVANRQGKVLEAQIEQVILSKGYVKLSEDQKRQLIRQDGVLIVEGSAWFCDQVPLHKNIYGAKWRLDFYVYHREKFPDGLHIECKWQGSSGSVDEKYVFTVVSLLELPGKKAFILAGAGARQGAVQWIRRKVSRRQDLEFFSSTDEFIHWANKSL